MRKRIMMIFSLLGMSLLLLISCRAVDAFAPFIVERISIPLGKWLGALASRISFPVFEATLLLSLSGIIVVFFRALWRSIKNRTILPLRKSLTNAIFAISIVLFLFTALWSPLYFVDALPSTFSYADTLHAPEELTQLCESLIERANALRDGLNEYKGRYALPYDYPTVMNMVPTLISYIEFVDGVPPCPKVFRYSELFHALRIAGLYAPWTGEAMVNTAELPVSIPFTACHEAAHSIGYAQEDDANFIAYLACMRGDRNFRYSGTISALYYAMDALYDADYSAWVSLRPKMTKAVQSDFYAMNGFRSITLPDRVFAGGQVVDAFLRVNGQDGLKSYGNMVNLLLSWEKSILNP